MNNVAEKPTVAKKTENFYKRFTDTAIASVKGKFPERITSKLKIIYLWTAKTDNPVAYIRVNYIASNGEIKESYWVEVHEDKIESFQD